MPLLNVLILCFNCCLQRSFCINVQEFLFEKKKIKKKRLKNLFNLISFSEKTGSMVEAKNAYHIPFSTLKRPQVNVFTVLPSSEIQFRTLNKNTKLTIQ